MFDDISTWHDTHIIYYFLNCVNKFSSHHIDKEHDGTKEGISSMQQVLQLKGFCALIIFVW